LLEIKTNDAESAAKIIVVGVGGAGNVAADYLINNVNTYFGYSDKDKIQWVQEQNNVKILILNKNQLDWNAIQELINDISSVKNV
jgi:cell division GTPase FtsZ